MLVYTVDFVFLFCLSISRYRSQNVYLNVGFQGFKISCHFSGVVFFCCFFLQRIKRAFKPFYDHTSSYVTVVFLRCPIMHKDP